jgi:feruloyl esterase
MRTTGLLSAVLLCGSWLTPANAQDASCTKLASLKWPNTTFTAAETVAAGDFPVPLLFPPGMPPTVMKLQARCRVTGTIRPTPDSDIRFEAWLPATGWNHRYQQVGNGGLAGAIQIRDMVGAFQRGSATASTDDGHVADGFDARWATGHPEKLVDYGDRAVHLTALAAQALVEAYYGERARHTYFTGCSDGGRESLMEAQRYPGDFDGYLVGAPGIDIPNTLISSAGAVQALEALPAAEKIGAAQLTALAKAGMERCDALDGLSDGVIEDPRICRFKPSELICKDTKSSSCLTPGQAAAVQKIYDGPKNPATGDSLAPGRFTTVGTEDRTWPVILVATPFGPPLVSILPGALGQLLYGSDAAVLDLTAATRDAHSLGPVMNSDNPDLRAARAAGKKIIHYHGWPDPNISPEYSLLYFEAVQKALRSDTRDFYRLFMAPGMAHCAGGVGPVWISGFGVSPGNRDGAADNSARPLPPEFDMVSALERWVEQGAAPERFVMTEYRAEGPGIPADGTPVKRTRPICPYPQTAVYAGTGSTDDATNFRCATPARK